MAYIDGLTGSNKIMNWLVYTYKYIVLHKLGRWHTWWELVIKFHGCRNVKDLLNSRIIIDNIQNKKKRDNIII